ncbi:MULTISPECIES: ribbon-helix-helix domain-containing protein [Microseira]|jgi:alkanesulfonate monooxygenase SsuD/methylene tetrahydromethanopterin reductase-like flavin-dependent oxidoreductase (luciferase family)|uniref:CopG-like ribbon-helix-helix domain-containing protein n=1 Tax=Microseira wollei NIES-4236 TaxID=2530354 RepID=A0AAV3XLB6_9CYAN|nr:ribbon-helix-helix protein, CopG family [Microseira wollei]GET43712.1 hypothetical protein MiSe_85370 [Microseira wollei NIES-4236]
MMDKRQDVRGEMAKRITITLPDEVAEALEKWAKEEGRPMANLATFLIQNSDRPTWDKRVKLLGKC